MSKSKSSNQLGEQPTANEIHTLDIIKENKLGIKDALFYSLCTYATAMCKNGISDKDKDHVSSLNLMYWAVDGL